MKGYWQSDTECYAHGISYKEDELFLYILCSDGLYHWNGDEDYAGYTEEELEARFLCTT